MISFGFAILIMMLFIYIPIICIGIEVFVNWLSRKILKDLRKKPVKLIINFDDSNSTNNLIW